MPSLLNATGAQQMARGQWFSAHDPLITKPGLSSTYKSCLIAVPYAHRLLRAWAGALDVDKSGATHQIGLFQADDGDATAGTTVGSANNLADSSATIVIQELTLASSDKVATAGSRMYWLLHVGSNNDDLMHMPNMTILVEPVTRSTL